MNRIALLGLLVACQIAHVISSVWMLAAIIGGSDRAWRIALAYDQLGNAATGGSERETISSRAYRGTKEGKRTWCLLCRLLHHIDRNHCEKSAEPEPVERQ